MNAGYSEEAGAWRDWLLRAMAGSPNQMQIMYGLRGERRLYEDARPVRVGNAAHAQLQLDVFGEVMDALYQARLNGLKPNDAAWAMQRALPTYLETVWEQPDYGIWEVRGAARHFTYSKVMAWVAFDCLCNVRPFSRCRSALSTIKRACQRRRLTGRRIRCPCTAHGRQLSAGVFSCRIDWNRVQLEVDHQASGTTIRITTEILTAITIWNCYCVEYRRITSG